ncbi:hypothetical protein RCO27_14210 [Sphingosinicella sp. LHD-64]|uniref:hypothetical protein n=1 Tax=Sphingosinicella sp. LHD-64 TaxID=3072139 RepID=UPI00280F9DAD|nr:hypothetical protein [Sphingosinicella sp. LHD-64]MDQ8757380.1 hypothetical protein [Sphingosinicella sp. LHD-64]
MNAASNGPNSRRGAAAMVAIGRVLLVLAFLALLGAWLADATDGAVAGLSQPHLFNDAIVLALLGIASMLDAFWHARDL